MDKIYSFKDSNFKSKNHIIFKAGTPTMGGLLILLAFTISTILWAKLDNLYIWIVLGVAIFFG